MLTNPVVRLLLAFSLLLVFTTSDCTPSEYGELTEDDCPTVCTREYSPVCATFGELRKTFGNPCTLKAEQCKPGGSGYAFLKDGECD